MPDNLPLDNKMDSIFRQKLDELDFPFREQDWDKMRQKIEQKKRRRGLLILWSLLGLLGVGAVGKFGIAYFENLPAERRMAKSEKTEKLTQKPSKNAQNSQKGNKDNTNQTNKIPHKKELPHFIYKKDIENMDTLFLPTLTHRDDSLPTDTAGKPKIVVIETLAGKEARFSFDTLVLQARNIDSVKFEQKFKPSYSAGATALAYTNRRLGAGIVQEVQFSPRLRASLELAYTPRKGFYQNFEAPISIAYTSKRARWNWQVQASLLPTLMRYNPAQYCPNCEDKEYDYAYAYFQTPTSNTLTSASGGNIYNQHTWGVGVRFGVGVERDFLPAWKWQTQVYYRNVFGRGAFGLRLGVVHQFGK